MLLTGCLKVVTGAPLTCVRITRNVKSGEDDMEKLNLEEQLESLTFMFSMYGLRIEPSLIEDELRYSVPSRIEFTFDEFEEAVLDRNLSWILESGFPFAMASEFCRNDPDFFALSFKDCYLGMCKQTLKTVSPNSLRFLCKVRKDVWTLESLNRLLDLCSMLEEE